MNMAWRQAMVVARRDFLAVAGTPSFFIFLLAPLLMLLFGVGSGSGAAYLATSAALDSPSRIAVLTDAATGAKLSATDARLRKIYRDDEAMSELYIVKPEADAETQANVLMKSDAMDVRAVMRGTLEAPVIAYKPPSDRHSRYLAALAEQTLRDGRNGMSADVRLSNPTIAMSKHPVSPRDGRKGLAFGAVATIFLLTLLLASQSIGMLAEEKSNKVIEILAAAAPLEAVFMGKLIGMFGVALLFIAFWGGIIGVGLVALPSVEQLTGFAPAIGWPGFILLCGAYFAMAFMLLGAVFLGIGAQASTMREIQMMSFPITLFQMGMFALSSAAAGQPGSMVARIAEVFPFSSPFAMGARAANDATLWPHFAALVWQALWVAITIWVAVKMFRMGVLKSGGGKRWFFGRKRAAPVPLLTNLD
jgi:ABC-2 type transport system permease protein